MPDTPVLIAGAGPTGLMLALWLARRGVALRIIDKNSGPGQASRAMAVQARTLEFYRQLGLADEVVARGMKIDTAHLREEGREVATLSLKDIGAGLSPYPFVLSFPQDDHERFLNDQLAALGVKVDWGTALQSFTQHDGGVRAVLRRGDAEEVCEAGYLCGCDGAHTVVRRQLDIGFPGGTYEQMFYVADVRVSGQVTGDLYMHVGPRSLVLMLPVRSSGMQRLIGIVPPEFSGQDSVTFEDIRPHAEALLGIPVNSVNWFATYRVHHRVAARFRVGRAFLAGDAGHLHSPAGGQGMNTGLGDAVNLAWKLADVLHGRAGAAILDTYQTERLSFAYSLVETTDRAFQGMVGQGWGSRVLRSWILPHLLPSLAGVAAVRRAIFRLVSQIRISYPDSALSDGKAGQVAGGDRLPWVGDNYDSLRALDWRLHVYGDVGADLARAAADAGIGMDRFAWNKAADEAGLARDAAYLVRPDGHVALALADQDAARLRAYAGGIGLSPGPAPVRGDLG